MDNRAIGVFDSGYGGLTAVKALRELLPNENIIYFGDSARAPYGSRSAEELKLMAKQDLELLLSRDVKAILAACGTVSSNAADVLESCSVKVIGVLKAGVKAMSRVTASGALAVIATEASIKSGAFERELKALCPDREIIALACPDFVPLIESGHYEPEDELVKAAVEKDLLALKDKNCAALLLGCTHFGIIGEAIKNYLGQTELISASESAAEEMRQYIQENELLGEGSSLCCLSSGEAEDFRRNAALFLGNAEVHVEKCTATEV